MKTRNNNGWLLTAVIVTVLISGSCSVGPVPAPAVPKSNNNTTPDTIVPTVTEISPTNGSLFDSSSILLTGEVKDNVSPSNVYYSINSSAFSKADLNPSTNGLYLFSEALSGLSNGTYTLKVYALDKSGNSSPTNSILFEILILGGTVEDPVITPVGGAYLDTVPVEIVCGTSNSTIRYTINGTIPGPSSPAYSAPFDITSDTIVTAKGFAYAMTNSSADSESYTITHKVSNTVFGTPEGTYSNDFVLNLTTPTTGAVAIFSTNGGADWVTNSSLTIDRSITVLSRSIAAGWVDSDTTSASYTLKASRPVVSQANGIYHAGFTTYFTSGYTSGVTFVYSTDGGTVWLTNTELAVDGTKTVLVKSIKYGYTGSDTVSCSYVLKPYAPAFSLASGSYPLPTNMIVTCATPGVTVYYTIDGTTPTTLSMLYNGQISLLSSKTIKAIAVIPGWDGSDVQSADYTLPGTSVFNDTNNHGAVPATNSLTGNGYDFHGLTNYMTVPSSTNNLLNVEGTIEALVNLHSFVWCAGIVHKGILTDFSDECYSLQLWSSSSVYLFLTGTNGTSTEIHSPFALNNDTWYHIVATWDEVSMYLYINGSLVASQAHGLGQIKTNDAPVVVGAQITNTYDGTYFNFGFDGIIDTVNLYNTLMTASNVTERYNAIMGL